MIKFFKYQLISVEESLFKIKDDAALYPMISRNIVGQARRLVQTFIWDPIGSYSALNDAFLSISLAG